MTSANNKKNYNALSLLEMIIALTIMAVLFAVFLPQFKNIDNSWTTQKANTEIVQNARIFIDYLESHLAKAVSVSLVSSSLEENGYIEYLDNEGATHRIDISENGYIQVGPVDSQAELAGPVSKLIFKCYSLDRFTVSTMIEENIRLINVKSTFTNESALGDDRDFEINVYLHTNPDEVLALQIIGSIVEFDSVKGKDIELIQIDETHYLCAYAGFSDDGHALVFTVDSGSITCGTACEYDTQMGRYPALVQIDSTHYLCVYQGSGLDLYAVVFTVDTGDWTVSANTAVVVDSSGGKDPDVCQVDATHYICVWQGDEDDGYAAVLTVNPSTWNVTPGTHYEYDEQDGITPSLCEVDDTHYICSYIGNLDAVKCAILEVDTSGWTVSRNGSQTIDNTVSATPVLSYLSGTSYMCIWQSFAENYGKGKVLTVNPSTLAVSMGQIQDLYPEQISSPAMCRVDDDSALAVYDDDGGDAAGMVLDADLTESTIIMGDDSAYARDVSNADPAVCKMNATDYLSAYTGDANAGFVVILRLGIRP